MPRARKKITSRGTLPDSVMRTAANICLEENQSIRSVAARFDICHVSLSRYIKKIKTLSKCNGAQPSVWISST